MTYYEYFEKKKSTTLNKDTSVLKPVTINSVIPHHGHINPTIWGPSFWYTLHNGAANYPVNASPIYIETMTSFILSFPIMLPCETCKLEAINYISLYKDKLKDICSKREYLFKFFVDFHNSVNIRYNKPEISIDDAIKKYITNI